MDHEYADESPGRGDAVGYSALARSTSAAEAARPAESSLVRAGLGGGEIAGFAEVGEEINDSRGRVADTDELPLGAAGDAVGADAPVKGPVGEGAAVEEDRVAAGSVESYRIVLGAG